MATQALVQQLQHRIERIETSARVDDGQTISSGCAAIDRMLPEAGYRRGTLIEWIGGATQPHHPSSERGGATQPHHPPSGRVGAAGEGAAANVHHQSSNSQHHKTHHHTAQGSSPSPATRSSRLPLPEGGCGSLVRTQKQFGSGGSAADYLSLLTASNACADGGALVIADRNRQFYPPAAAAMGIDLGNVVVIRPPEEKSPHDRRYDDEFFWAIDQALGCSAVAAVWGAIDQVGERWFRRFQLSAESSGTMGLFVRPPSAIGQPGWAEVQWHVAAKRSHAAAAATQHVELKLARCRGGRSGKKIDLQIDTVTGNVSQATSQESIAS